MNRLRRLRKTASAGTLFIFLLSNSVYGLVPSVEVVPSRETPAFLRIDVPSDLARVEDIYEAPPKVDPSLIVHIQNAHGNYEAQLKIRKLMQYLYKTYGFKLFFVEGAVDRLNPDYLKLLDDTDHNRQVAEALAREGKLTGAEFYLVDAPKDVAAVGIEQPDLYRANYEAFQEVYGFENDTREFLEKIDQRLSQIASRVFSPDLRRMVQEWRKFESGQREFMPYVKSLSQEARKTLGVDLESLYAQAEWPHLSRLLILQSMEKDLDLEKGKAEKAAVILELRKLGISQQVVQAIEGLEEKKITMNSLEPGDERLENLPRYLIERLIEEASPKGFRFSDYPDFGLYAGYFILKSEVDSKLLFEEIEKLFEKILDRLASEEKDKKLLMLFRDQELLRKFFALEISREQWDKFAERQSVLAPEAFETRIQKQEAGPSIKISKNVLQAFQTGVKFYHLARQRDLVFFYRIKQAMLKQKESKSTLLTGGFHTEGVFDRFRKEDVNYGVLMPRIGGEINRDVYVKTMLDTHPSMFKTSTVEQPAIAVSFAALAAQGVKDVYSSVKVLVEAAIKKNLDWVRRGTDAARDYYSARRFTEVYNASPMAALRRSELRLTAAEDYAYLFVDGKPIVGKDGFLGIRTTEVKDAAGVKVRVFGTHTDFVAESPESQGIEPRKFDPIAPLDDDEGAAVPDLLPADLDRELAGIAPAPVVDREAALRAERVQALSNLNIISPEALQVLGDAENLKRFLELLDVFVSTRLDPEGGALDRRNAAIAGSLAAMGFVSPDASANDFLEFVTNVISLAVSSRSESAKGLDALKNENGNELPGTLFVVTDQNVTAGDGIAAIVAEVFRKPNQNIFYVLTPPEGQAPDVFLEAAKAMEKAVLEELKRLGVKGAENRFGVNVVTQPNERLIKNAISSLYNKHVRTDGTKHPVDHRSSTNAYAVLAAGETRSLLNFDKVMTNLPATLIESQPLNESLHHAELSAAAWFSARLNLQDKSGMMMSAFKQASSISERTNQALQKWEIIPSGLNALMNDLAVMLEAFKRLAASA